MNVFRTVTHWIKQASLLPHTIALGLKQRKWQQTVVNAREVERLDRLRNPSKYLGK